MAIIIIRTLIIYAALLAAMRLLGKRQLGEMELSEFVVAALIADLAAHPLQDLGIPMINGLVPILTLFCCEVAISRAALKSAKLRALLYGKPSMLIKKGVIDQREMAKNSFTTDELMQELRNQGCLDISRVEYAVLETDAKTGRGINQLSPVVRQVLKDQIARWQERGQVGRPVRAMVVGVPNVGKSTFINKVAKKKSAKASDRPGVTRGKQWVNVDAGLDLLDTPGILWPKFEDERTGMDLAFTGAVKDDIMDVETLGCHLMALLGKRYPQALMAAYKLPEIPAQDAEENEVAYGYRLLCQAGQKRGMKISGGEVDTERMARVLLDEYRAGKLGTFTLEVPEGV